MVEHSPQTLASKEKATSTMYDDDDDRSLEVHQ